MMTDSTKLIFKECPAYTTYEYALEVLRITHTEILFAAKKMPFIALSEMRLLHLFDSLAKGLRDILSSPRDSELQMQQRFIEAVGLLNEDICPIVQSDRYVRYPISSHPAEIIRCEWVVQSGFLLTELTDIIAGFAAYRDSPPGPRKQAEDMGRKRLQALAPIASSIHGLSHLLVIPEGTNGPTLISAITTGRFQPMDGSPYQTALSNHLQAEQTAMRDQINEQSQEFIKKAYEEGKVCGMSGMSEEMERYYRLHVAKLN